MINISIEVIEKLHDRVNAFFRKNNESSYLKMAYKKVLFLIVFTKKKKYYGILYESKLNFIKKFFIWRVETVKRGHSILFHKIEKRIMNEFIMMNNIHILHQIVKEVLKKIVNDIS